MTKAEFKSVDEYIASQPEVIRSILAQVRKAIRDSVPRVEEEISYKMPTYKVNGEVVLYFAAWKQHTSLYPATGRVLAEFKEELEPYKIHKATIRFPVSRPIPMELIARIAKFRAKEVTSQKNTKGPASTKS
jgi:uncharacterized protein YdhG (YjbR/CyaY superfamily)